MTMRQILVAGALITLGLPAHATIEWDFTPTAMTCGKFDNGRPLCKLTRLPVASLTLDGPDSTGTAFFDSYNPPVLTGDPFRFSLAGEAHAVGKEHISSTEPIGLGCEFCASGDSNSLIPWDIVDYSLSWREVAGSLDLC
jgi:hypothetical protein